MGHSRLGRIPRKGKWNLVFQTFEYGSDGSSAIASATAAASAREFDKLRENSAVNYCVWTLVSILSASRQTDFQERLRGIGIDLRENATSAEFISSVARTVDKEMRKRGTLDVISQLAAQSLRTVISQSISERSGSLFGASIADVQEACKQNSTKEQFGIIARRYFAHLMSSTIRFVADKEVANYVGSNKSFKSIEDVENLHRGIESYCHESGDLIQTFAKSWYSKAGWEEKGGISEKRTKRLTSHAFKKLQMEVAEGDK